jgi:hypothetical protein
VSEREELLQQWKSLSIEIGELGGIVQNDTSFLRLEHFQHWQAHVLAIEAKMFDLRQKTLKLCIDKFLEDTEC